MCVHDVHVRVAGGRKGLHKCGSTHLLARVCVHMYACIGILDPSLFHLVHRGRVSQSNQEPPSMTSATGQPVVGIPSVCPPQLELQASSHTTRHLCEFFGLDPGSHIFVATFPALGNSF